MLDFAIFGSRRERWTIVLAVATAGILLVAGVHFLLASIVAFAILIPPWIPNQPDPTLQTLSGFATGQASGAHPAEIGSVINALPVPLLLMDRDGNVLAQNQTAIHVFGKILTGTHVSSRLRSPAILDMIRDAVASNAARETDHIERVPTETVYRAHVEAATDTEGNEPVYVLSFWDISEVQRIDRMRSDFVANASHELRTPLASLRGFIETMQGPARNDAVAREKFLAIMLEQTNRMSRLVDDLLSLSRLELKANIPPSQMVELGPVLRSVVATLQPMAQDLGVTISLDIPEQPITIVGDRDELTEVFENLIENACKYGQSGKAVDVRMDGRQNGPVDVSVTDYGPGIDKDHVPRLTERFYRAGSENTGSRKGTGLGLAIVKHILTRHRATLGIQSELGKGSTFTVRF